VGITSAFGYDQFEHWKMMAQQNCSVPRTIKMKGSAELTEIDSRCSRINKKSAGCIDTRHSATEYFIFGNH